LGILDVCSGCQNFVDLVDFENGIVKSLTRSIKKPSDCKFSTIITLNLNCNRGLPPVLKMKTIVSYSP
jgi:hypothetical protein